MLSYEKAAELLDIHRRQIIPSFNPDLVDALQLGIAGIKLCQTMPPHSIKSLIGGGELNRCLNDLFSYCKTKPDAQATEVDVPFVDLGGGHYIDKCWITTCSQNPKDCSNRITNTELQEQNTH